MAETKEREMKYWCTKCYSYQYAAYTYHPISNHKVLRCAKCLHISIDSTDSIMDEMDNTRALIEERIRRNAIIRRKIQIEINPIKIRWKNVLSKNTARKIKAREGKLCGYWPEICYDENTTSKINHIIDELKSLAKRTGATLEIQPGKGILLYLPDEDVGMFYSITDY